jgi:hypothetical protein
VSSGAVEALQDGSMTLEAWRKFAAFQVFGDYAPMTGFRLVMQLGAQSSGLHAALEQRAIEQSTLDPELARVHLRAGLGLAQSGLATFVYATPEDVVAVVRPDVVGSAGTAVEIQNQLLGRFSARLALLAGREIPAQARIYEFPDLVVVRRALCALQEEVEETTPLRSSLWLGSQLRGRGQAFHPSMLETLEEQTSLLTTHGIDMDALPSWWWRGIAASVDAGGAVEIYDELPMGEAFGELVPED